MVARTINSATETFSYNGQLMTDANGVTISYDENGNMLNLPYDLPDVNLLYTWDNMLRYGEYDTNTVTLKYDHMGNRIWRQAYNGATTTTRKYIVDIVGDLPTILLEIDTADSSVKKSYIYAQSEIIARHDGVHTASRYFYLHDGLGNIRQVIDTAGKVVNQYTYNPFGEALEAGGSLSNPFMFTGQYYDSEIGEYYLRARQYDPHLGRFTGRDPVFGDFEDTLTLHAYLYSINDPINKNDPTGEMAYVGALGRAKELKYSISAYYVSTYSLLGMSGEPGDILDIAVGANAAREGWFSKRYGNKNDDFKQRLIYLVAPKDTSNVKWECPETEGFYRHCVASCRLNSIIKMPAITLYFALEAGSDWPSKDWTINNMSDVIADFAGIAVSYITPVPLVGCRTMCAPMSKAMSAMLCP